MQVYLGEKELAARVKRADGRWDGSKKLWELPADKGRELGLGERVVQPTFGSSRRRMPCATVSISRHPADEGWCLDIDTEVSTSRHLGMILNSPTICQMERTMPDASPLLDQMSKWPASWQIDDGDLVKGQEIVTVFAEFVRYLADRGLKQRTIQRYCDNLWLLGGEIIGDVNICTDDRQKTAFELLDSAMDDEGGPLSRHLSTESEVKSFDATCRKLHKFLEDRREHLTNA